MYLSVQRLSHLPVSCYFLSIIAVSWCQPVRTVYVAVMDMEVTVCTV